jgi:putative ABC transport system substrate-binding protein
MLLALSILICAVAGHYLIRRRRCGGLFGGLYLGLAAFGPASTALALDILVLQSHDGPPYRQTLEGFKSALSQRGLAADFDVQTVDESASTAWLAERLTKRPPQLLLTLGTPATRTSLALNRTIPSVSGLVLDNEELHAYPHMTGVGLDFAPSLQWQWLRRILPDARHIAVIYDPRHGIRLFQALQQMARTEGMELISAPASSPEDLPTLLKQLPSQLDAIWAVDGVTAFNAGAVRELLLYSFRNRTPLIGLSAQWVRAGAIYALDWDYTDLGMQAGELAWAILGKGSSPAALPPQTPRKVRPVFNNKTAEHMKLAFPELWQTEIAEVVQ